MSLSTAIKAGVVALALSATALVALPAQAAPLPFSFSLNLGGPGFPDVHNNSGIILHFGDPDYFNSCLSDKQVRHLVADNDFSHVRISKYDNKHNKVWVIAQSDDDDEFYMMRVDRCSGKVDKVHQIDDDDN